MIIVIWKYEKYLEDHCFENDEQEEKENMDIPKGRKPIENIE